MKRHTHILCVALVGLATVTGCARAARDTTGFALTDSAIVNAPIQETWVATREALQGQDYEIYTRDKRGRFVAYSNMHRHLFLVPTRNEFTITLEEETPSTTRVTIQTLRQVYGTTLLTYPDWHSRQAKDHSDALSILEAIQTQVNGTPAAPAEAVTYEAPPAAQPQEEQASPAPVAQ